MILVLRPGTTDGEAEEVLRELQRLGLGGRLVHGRGSPLVHVTAGSTRRARRLLRMEQVVALVPTSGPRVRSQGRRFYPYYFVNWSAASIVLLGLLVLLAGHLPPGIGSAVDLHHPPREIAAPWYARAPLAFVAAFPRPLAWLGWVVLLLLAAAVFFLPLLDRTRGRTVRERWIVVVAGAAIALAAVLLSLSGGGT